VTDVNEAPYNLTILDGTSVKENQPEQTLVGTLFALDEDYKDVSKYLSYFHCILLIERAKTVVNLHQNPKQMMRVEESAVKREREW
jgi:hypothetical protein